MARVARDQITIIELADGADGDDGSNGSDAVRYAEVTLYTNPTVANAPSAPSATITWSTGAISSITSGWSQTPPTISATSSNSVYSSQLIFIDATAPFTTTTVTGTASIQSVNFTGAVTFTSGNFIVGGSTITTIDGSNIDTGSITADQIAANSITAANIDVDNLVLTSRNILTIDGSQIATRTHRTSVDDYIDDLAGVTMSPSGSSANGTNVLSANNSDLLRYRFRADVDNTSINSPNNEFRTKRFYYPIVTSVGGHYTVVNNTVKFFSIEDIAGAQGTGFYTTNNSNDMYRAGNNNNDRTVALNIPGALMYLNQVEILTEINPAIEYDFSGRVHMEMQVTPNGTNIPSFTQINFEAFAVNIEEFFTITTGGAPGVDHAIIEDFETITNVQLTGTTTTTPYVTVASPSIVRVVGNGEVYGVVRGY